MELQYISTYAGIIKKLPSQENSIQVNKVKNINIIYQINMKKEKNSFVLIDTKKSSDEMQKSNLDLNLKKKNITEISIF